MIWVALAVFALSLTSNVLMWLRIKKALGLRGDWKRRFDKMKESLGL